MIKAIVFKNNRLLFSRTIGYCFPYSFPIVLQSKNSETGCQNANMLPKLVVETLKKWAPSRQVTFKCPLPPGLEQHFLLVPRIKNHLSSFELGFLNIFLRQNLLRSMSLVLFLL